MATNYPVSKDFFQNPLPTDELSMPDHAGQHANANDAIEALQDKVGINGSMDPNSHENRIYSLEMSLNNSTANYLLVSDIGVPSGVAGLDAEGNVLSSQLSNLDLSGTTNVENLTIGGTLTFNGTATKINSTTLTVTDPLIYIGENNPSNTIDLGLVSSFNNGTYQHSGLVRDASDGKWKLFQGVTDEPTATINFNQASYATLKIGQLEADNGYIYINGNYIPLGGSVDIPAASNANAYSPGIVYGITSSGSNTSVGYGALGNSGNNLQNSAFGLSALRNVSSGSHNSAFGSISLYSNQSGSNNSSFGDYALFSNVSASDNTAVGQQSLIFTTGHSNSALGSSSGSNLTTGSNNLLLGYNAQPTSASVSNEITLGDNSINRFRIPGLGIDWTSSNVPTSNSPTLITPTLNSPTLSIAYKYLYAAGLNKDYILVSSDGLSWSTIAFPGYCYRELRMMNNKLVAIGTSSNSVATTQGLVYSNNSGTTWTTVTLPVSDVWKGGGYINGKYVVVGINNAVYSSDLANWTTVSLPDLGAAGGYENYWTGVYVVNGRLYAFRSNYGLYTDDGVTWNEVTFPISTVKKIIYANNKYTIIGGSYSASSANGLTNWTTYSMPSAGSWSALAYNNGIYVASKDNENIMAYSYDASTWNSSSFTYQNGVSIDSIEYFNGKFIGLVASSLDLVVSSTDGINWSLSNKNIAPSQGFNVLLKIEVDASITPEELKNIDGVNAPIQAQLDGKLSLTAAESTYARLNGASLTRSVLTSPFETNVVSATAATGTINVDVSTSSVYYYTANSASNWIFNFRGNSSTSLNSVLSDGQSATVVFLVTNGATAYYPTSFQIDGVTTTVKWQGGTAPSSGNASSIDMYTYTVFKTASSTYTVLGSQAKFA